MLTKQNPTQPKKLSDKQVSKRSAIIDAAIEIFSLKGFHRTKISDIARQANVADGTVYLYFCNKDDLLMQAFDEVMQKLLIRLREVRKYTASPIEQLHRAIRIQIELLTENPRLGRFLVIEMRQTPEFYEKYPEYQPLKEYLGLIESLCRSAIKKGEIRNVNISALLSIIYGSIDFVITRWLLMNEKCDLEHLYNEIVNILRFGLQQ